MEEEAKIRRDIEEMNRRQREEDERENNKRQ